MWLLMRPGTGRGSRTVRNAEVEWFLRGLYLSYFHRDLVLGVADSGVLAAGSVLEISKLSVLGQERPWRHLYREARIQFLWGYYIIAILLSRPLDIAQIRIYIASSPTACQAIPQRL